MSMNLSSLKKIYITLWQSHLLPASEEITIIYKVIGFTYMDNRDNQSSETDRSSFNYS